jgi:hypothetical protein
MDLNEIEAAVLALPPEQRGHLLDSLLTSLDDVADQTDPEEVERAWIAEAERRRQQFLSGESNGIPAEEAIARARADLGSSAGMPDYDAEQNTGTEVQRAWMVEAESRHCEYLAGGVDAIPASEALTQVRAELGGSATGG